VRKVEENTPFRKIRQRGVGRVESWRPAGRSGPARGGAGPDGPKSEENSFLKKIKFLNIARLWKFAQEDLGGILT
jgi:hypothetical protein